ncbi:MAG: hypothetical protein U9R26_03455 [Campylobacterota bacterium]|nr:hypothetical protein [Campylobacterota bacterium]
MNLADFAEEWAKAEVLDEERVRVLEKEPEWVREMVEEEPAEAQVKEGVKRLVWLEILVRTLETIRHADKAEEWA